MSTVHPKVEKSSREQLLAEQLKNEHVRLKDIDKMEQKELEAGSFLASYTRGKYEFSKEGECTCKKYMINLFAAISIFHYQPTLLSILCVNHSEVIGKYTHMRQVSRDRISALKDEIKEGGPKMEYKVIVEMRKEELRNVKEEYEMTVYRAEQEMLYNARCVEEKYDKMHSINELQVDDDGKLQIDE